MTELVLSASSVEAYRTCEYRWYLQYVETHPGKTSPEAAVGLAVHAGAEAYYRTRLERAEHEVEAGLDAYEFTIVLETLTIEDFDPDLRKIGRRVLQSYIEDVGAVTEPVLVEHAGTITVNGILYSYHIDLADARRVVRDLKVKKAKPRDPSRYAFALTGYALAYRADTGETESDAQLDVMVRLKRDRPYHVPISHGGPYTDVEIGQFAAELERTAEGIDKGRFRPTGLPKECPWCPVAYQCEYWTEYLSRRQSDAEDKWFAQSGNDAAGHEHWGL